VRDPEASDSFTLAQLERVFEVADGQTIRLQTGEGWVDDYQWLGRFVRTLAYTGMHISVFSGAWRRSMQDGEAIAEYVPPIDSTAIREGFLFWRRPKNEKPIPMPIKKDIAPWLGEFFDHPRPRSTRRYEQILEDMVEAEVGFPANPLRFRHTCGVILYHVLKLDAATVQKLMGFTPETMLTYVIRTKEQIAAEMVEKGW
jgi:hypothetical protein